MAEAPRAYPVNLIDEDDGTVLVTSPDFPELRRSRLAAAHNRLAVALKEPNRDTATRLEADAQALDERLDALRQERADTPIDGTQASHSANAPLHSSSLTVQRVDY